MTPEILRLHKTGIPAFEIAEQVHLGRTLVCKILRQEGVRLYRGSPMRLTPADVSWAMAQLRDGRAITPVAKELGVSTTLIRIRLKERQKQQKQG
jgi:hypothetical protein